MPVCALSAAESLAAVSIGRIIISAFCVIRMPPLIFMSYCRFLMYYPGMYYIFCCFESVTVGLSYIDVTALS